MASNGRLPASELSYIYSPGEDDGEGRQLRLTKEAAAAWNTMAAWAKHYFKISIIASEAYRTIARQNYFWDLWQRGLGNLAAVPGTSNHGLALAVDLASTAIRAWIDRFGARFGFSKSWSDAPSEWWHVLYQSGHWPVHPDPGPDLDYPIVRKGSGGKGSYQQWYVKDCQKLLVKTGYLKHVTGLCGKSTDEAIRDFQRDRKGLKVDGVCAKLTWKALRRAAKNDFRKKRNKGKAEHAPAAKQATHSNKAHISSSGIKLIKNFEGYLSKAYQDSVGVWTIGWGHTGNVQPGDTTTRREATKFLKEDVGTAEKAVRSKVKVRINQNQFDALVSFIYNVGPGAFASSTLLKVLNQGDYKGAADQFLRWDKATEPDGTVISLLGLTRRRKAERKLFLTH